ncbi:phytanoyl-CoA dioxygenase family protein [Bowmanella denitrificans]|uniref:phytanoyl-CoA dioxygenase family protein n=1 Tax=Bowmanella denitrificans TaxID=366582 RepID=UPI000C9B1C56|nr:phytanoyl-CoA dioxygenase family protein [Bowmanella denitrificans]
MITNASQSSDIPIETVVQDASVRDTSIQETSLAEQLSEHAIVQHTRPLIENLPDAGFAKPHIDALASLLGDITGISAHSDLGHTLGMNLKSGVALSPVQAAKCLTELMRTHSFMHAVARAVKDQLDRKGQVEIVYAGTGPYGLLMLPLLACLKDSRIQATLIDIHEENVQAVRAVVSHLNIASNIRSIEQEDATCWTPPSGRKFDIVLSETMNWMLNNEPQVMIFSHLVQYLRDEHSTLIPQKVVMDACLYNAAESNQFRMGKRKEPPQESRLGVVGCLDREAAGAIANGDRTLLNARITIPDPLPPDQTTLKFRTEIQIYQDLWLKDGQCSLNTPLCFSNSDFHPGDVVNLSYIYAESTETTPGYDIRFPPRKQVIDEPASDQEVGELGIIHLKRLWHKFRLQREGKRTGEDDKNEWNRDMLLMDLLHLGLQDCLSWIFQEASTFSQFEQWVLEKNGGQISRERVKEINAAMSDRQESQPKGQKKFRYLSPEQRQFWEENGFLVVENVLDPDQCQKTVDLIYRFLDKTQDNPETWYQDHPSQRNIMVHLFQDPILEMNRQSTKAQRVFYDLWQSENLRFSTDQVGFNPPETSQYKFPGTRLHWDLDFSCPLTFGTQGLFYLTDVAENQGAFRCVPGFHRQLKDWLKDLPSQADPNQQDLSALPVRYIAAPAGSLVVWHQFLPHGSSPNTAATPRVVQYFNMLSVNRPAMTS